MRQHRAHLTYPEVAERHPREDASRRPVVARQQVDDHPDAEQMVVGSEELVQQEQLPDRVGEVQRLRRHV